jgi:hypothetical protein
MGRLGSRLGLRPSRLVTHAVPVAIVAGTTMIAAG